MNSSVSKHVVTSKGTINTQEQSGWTAYLQDFSLEQRENSNSDSDNDDSFCSPSMVSDAASYAAWKIISDKNQVDAGSSFDPLEFPKRLDFNKPRRKTVCNEDLEDTASSPVNSPKISSVKQMDINHRRPNDSFGDFLGKDAGSYPFSGLQSNGNDSINYYGMNDDSTELRKRGLCLVPFSMLRNN